MKTTYEFVSFLATHLNVLLRAWHLPWRLPTPPVRDEREGT